MSTKLGETLIAKGLLSRKQLHKALETQLIFGGHLGTCLVELGLIDELTLARSLAAIHDVKCARPEMFDDIPREILAKIPVDEVRRRQVIPVGVSPRALHVATVQPNDLQGLASLTRNRIVPYVAPEIRIVLAMEKFYGIPRRKRYLSIPCGSQEAPAPQPPAAAPAPPAKGAPRGAAKPSGPRLGEFSRRLSRAESHAEVGEALLDYAHERMGRVILFDVDAGRAQPVNWRGVDLERPGRSGPIQVTPESLFGLIAQDVCYRGPLPSDFDCAPFYGRLEIEPPEECLVLGIYGEDQLEAVLYGDPGPMGAVQGTTDNFRLVLEEVGLALKMLSYKLQLCP